MKFARHSSSFPRQLSMRQFKTESKRISLRMPSTSDWYRLYFSALVETDRNKALPQIERAQEAIQGRCVELSQIPPENPREMLELNKAQNYLGILLRNVGSESERLLWDC
jgi:hypothetical protein